MKVDNMRIEGGIFVGDGEEAEKELSIEEKEALVDRLTQELYGAHRGFKPRYPWVFVRTLAKEQQVGRIIAPETQQNKPMHEAIVLAVWPSFVDAKTVNGKMVAVLKQSELHPGDHVLLPHFAGLPVVGYRDMRYRIVKEEGWSSSTDGGICAVVNYDEPDKKPINKLKARISFFVDRGFKSWDEVMATINDEFLIVDRDAQSVTLSGR